MGHYVGFMHDKRWPGHAKVVQCPYTGPWSGISTAYFGQNIAGGKV